MISLSSARLKNAAGYVLALRIQPDLVVKRTNILCEGCEERRPEAVPGGTPICDGCLDRALETARSEVDELRGEIRSALLGFVDGIRNKSMESLLKAYWRACHALAWDLAQTIVEEMLRRDPDHMCGHELPILSVLQDEADGIGKPKRRFD